jgi:hypothetical protein
MIPSRRSFRPIASAPILMLLLSLVLGACGGSPGSTPPPESQTVAGTIVLPADHGLDLASLVVTTPVGTYPVGADGAFSADVFAGAQSEIGVENEGGALVLLGVSEGDQVVVSVESTAEALLYYLVGGMGLPIERQDRLRDLLRGHPDAAPLAAELRRQLTGGGNGLAAPDADTLAALEAVHQALFDDVEVAAFVAGAAPHPAGAPGFSLAPSEVDGTNLLIEPGDATQSGVQVLQNPAGPGVVAQNAFRRPAALLAYEVAWEDADGVQTPIDPPVFAGRVEVPATGQLEVFNAIFDVLTGDAPWSPVLSPHLNLAGRANASRTHYQLVLLGPSTSARVPSIMSDVRFEGFHDAWDDVVTEKSLELFLDQLLLPLVEVYGFGALARYDASQLTQMRARVRLIADEHLLGLGVYLRAGRSGYADALRFAIDRLVESREFRLELMDTIVDAIVQSDKNRVNFEALERRLSSRASASAIAAAVQATLVGGDVAKIMVDLLDSTAAEDWTAISAQALFALSPAQARVSSTNASARFAVRPKGTLTGTYLYRWTTSGHHGTISDLLEDGTAIDTDSSEIWYFHDWPTDIQDDDVDSISVEVFEVDPGATRIPAGAEPVARMAASVVGDEREIDARLVMQYGATRAGWGCSEMVLRFDPVPGARSYTVRVRGIGGEGDPRNGNQEVRLDGPDHDLLVDPALPFTEDGNVGPIYDGPCRWTTYDGTPSLAPNGFTNRWDADEEQFLVYVFTHQQHGFGDYTPAGVMHDLWLDWLDDATFEIVAHD